MTQEYVLIFPRARSRERILIIEKNRPAWQAGALNLCGGKIEQGESVEDAAVRELQEETGIGAIGKPERLGVIVGTNAKIYVVAVLVDDESPIVPRPEETERVSWRHWDSLKNDARLIPNLKVILPLCMSSLSGWTITDVDNHSVGNGAYRITVDLN